MRFVHYSNFIENYLRTSNLLTKTRSAIEPSIELPTSITTHHHVGNNFTSPLRMEDLIGMILRRLLMRSSMGKALEHRSALTPTTAKVLIDARYTVNVERSSERIFDDSKLELHWYQKTHGVMYLLAISLLG